MNIQGLTIFARTFLLTLAALALAVGIGVSLLVLRPPMHNAPVSLSEIARQLSIDTRGPHGPMPGGPRPQGPPPPGFDLRDRPPPPPGGMGPRPGPSPTRREWRLSDSATAPASPGYADFEASVRLGQLLAARLGVEVARVRLFVRDAPSGPGAGDDPQLREGFVAAWQRDSGEWRVMESVVEGFPNAFQRQVFWLSAIGLLILLPVSWWFARTLAAPIRSFATGARRLGADPHAPALERTGPPEMLDAIDSFNAMQGRITRLLQERSQMVGAIAHDLRTPLMRLAFRLDNLESPLKEKVEADINEMKLMISAALDFMRDQSATTARERLDLRLLVESVVDDAVDVGHDVSFASGEAVALQGDPLALRRMVSNLVDNALKYGQRARLRVLRSGDMAVLEVDDDGPGIPEAMQSRVFDPFVRIEASRNRDTGGIGLGLTTVRAVVLDHGGQVELRNRKDGGLRVAVSLPVH